MTNEQTAVVPVEVRAVASVFGSDDPVAIVARVSEIAAPLGAFIRSHHMSRVLESANGRAKRLRERPNEPPREYVHIEGWAFLGQLLGISAVTRRVDPIVDPEGNIVGFEAHADLVTRAGEVVGSGIGECSWVETHWGTRDPFALRSMAQTRAVGKAYRLNFGFVMAAAGFEATPIEEMAEELEGTRRAQQSATASEAPDDWMVGAGKFIARATEALALSENDVLRLMDCATRSELVERAQRDGGWNALAETLKGRAGPPTEVEAKPVEVAS